MTRVAVALLLGIAVSAPAADAVTRARYLMGTVCEITADDVRDTDAAFDEAARVEAMLSTWRDDSELARLNRGQVSRVSPELYQLLTEAMTFAHATGGAFDPLMRPLIDVWRTRADGRVPSRDARAQAAARCALANATLADGAIALANGAQFEEGGFGKGYALGKMLVVMQGSHVVLNFGGQLAVRGSEVVTIAHPAHRERPYLSLVLRDASLSTTSGAEKSFLVVPKDTTGRRFSHIIDPATGEALPPRGSVSVIDRSPLAADALSTALYVMGPERGLAWARAHDVTAIFISESGEITTSRPIEGLTTVKESP
jgi:thiamine biosynthesis lipoprotein